MPQDETDREDLAELRRRRELTEDAAATAYRDARRQLDDQSRFPTRDTGAAERLPALIDRAATADERAARADRHVQQLTCHPTVVSQPDPAAVLAAARKAWKQARDQDQGQRHAAAPATSRTLQHAPLTPSVDRSPGIGF